MDEIKCLVGNAHQNTVIQAHREWWALPTLQLMGSLLLMTTGIASSNPQTLVAKANFDHCTTPTEKLTVQARTTDNLLQQIINLLDLSKYSEAIAPPGKCIISYKTPILTVIESVMLVL